MTPAFLVQNAPKPFLAEVLFGHPRTFPECYYIGICRMNRQDEDDFTARCPSAKAWLSRSEMGLKIRFVRSSVQPCALAAQFAGNVFRIMSPYGLPTDFAETLGLPQNTVWEIPQGDFPVRASRSFLTVDFPLVQLRAAVSSTETAVCNM